MASSTLMQPLRETCPAETGQEPLRLLIVEDSVDDAELLVHHLRAAGFAPRHRRVGSAAELESALDGAGWDIVVSDFEMPGFDGLHALRVVRRVLPDVPFIIHSGKIDQDTAVEAMRSGAQDFVMKQDGARLVPAIRREIEEARIRRERRQQAKLAQHLRGRLEAQRMVVHEMKQVDAMKDRFVEAVTHEMRTPMTPLKSAIDLLLDGEAGPLTEPQRQVCEMMKRNVDRLCRFASSVLHLSRIGSGGQRLRAGAFDLGERLRHVIGLFGPRAAGKGSSVRSDVDSGLRAFADADAFDQVLTNLLENALAHSPDGAAVTVAARPAGSRLVEVSVSDNGEGIPDEALEHVFDRFFQLRHEPGPGYRGTGLGLAICKGLVEGMGGTISVRSGRGLGTTFTFTLPSGGEGESGRNEGDEVADNRGGTKNGTPNTCS